MVSRRAKPPKPKRSNPTPKSSGAAPKRAVTPTLKVIGVVITAFIPAFVSWVDSKIAINKTLTVTATEQVKGDESYAKLVLRLNRIEDDMRTMGTTLQLVKGDAMREPIPKLSSKRPTVSPEKLEQALKLLTEE